MSGLRRLSKLSEASTPLYRCVSAETAAAVWAGAASGGLTSASGLVSCVLDRGAAIAAAAKAATYPVPGADVKAYLGDAKSSAGDRAAVSKRQYWAAYRGQLDEINAMGKDDSDDEGYGEDDANLPDLPAGVVD